MERIESEVREIESSLHSSRQLLHALTRSSQRTISSEVDGIRTSLKKADNKIESTLSHIQAFRAQISAVENAEISVNLDSQMRWLHNSLAKIVQDLESADSNARSAMESTDTYIYKIMDLKQDVEARSSALTEHHGETTNLLVSARLELLASEDRLKSIQNMVATKEEEIRSKNKISALTKQRKITLEQQSASINSEIAEAEYQYKRRKDHAKAGAGLAILGVLAAPITFGASLAVTGAAVAGTTYKAVRMDDFKAEANSLQASVNSLNKEILLNNQAVARLEQERSAAQIQLRSYQEIVSKNQADLSILEQRARTMSHTNNEIESLQLHATSTTQTAKDALPQLRNVKNSLEACSALVHEKSVEVSAFFVWSDLAAGLVLGESFRRTKVFRRQISTMEKVCDTLNQIHLDAPKLLPSIGTKFLDVKPWTSFVPGIEATSPVPAICLY